MSETPKKPVQETDPWKIMKKFRADKSGGRKTVYAGVNGRVYQVPCGKEVEVPLPIYEQLEKQRLAEEKLEEERDKINETTKQ